MASQNVETFRAAHEGFNRRDFDGVVSKMADGFTYHDRARNVTFAGRNGFKEFMQGWAEAFSNAAVSDPSYLDRNLSTTMGHSTGLIREQCPVW